MFVWLHICIILLLVRFFCVFSFFFFSFFNSNLRRTISYRTIYQFEDLMMNSPKWNFQFSRNVFAPFLSANHKFLYIYQTGKRKNADFYERVRKITFSTTKKCQHSYFTQNHSRICTVVPKNTKVFCVFIQENARFNAPHVRDNFPDHLPKMCRS